MKALKAGGRGGRPGCLSKIYFSLSSATSFVSLILTSAKHQKKPTSNSKSDAKKIKI